MDEETLLDEDGDSHTTSSKCQLLIEFLFRILSMKQLYYCNVYISRCGYIVYVFVVQQICVSENILMGEKSELSEVREVVQPNRATIAACDIALYDLIFFLLDFVLPPLYISPLFLPAFLFVPSFCLFGLKSFIIKEAVLLPICSVNSAAALTPPCPT